MRRVKRTTNKIIIIEDRENNRVILKKNSGWFKNLINKILSKNYKTDNIMVSVWGLTISLFGILASCMADAVALNLYESSVERINSTYSPAAAQALIEQTFNAPTAIAPWGAAIGGAAAFFSLAFLAIILTSHHSNNAGKSYIIDYDEKIVSDFFTSVPDHLFEKVMIFRN